jgi:flagellar biosynthesis/type III secretory pathway chaperone
MTLYSAFFAPQPPQTTPITQLIADTSALAQDLLDILRRESEALASQRLMASTGFVEAKTRLISAYASKMEELREATMVAEAEPALAELRALNARVLESARANAAALQGAMDAGNRLLEIVVKSVNRQRAPATVGYGRLGNRPSPRTSGRTTPMMVTKRL